MIAGAMITPRYTGTTCSYKYDTNILMGHLFQLGQDDYVPPKYQSNPVV